MIEGREILPDDAGPWLPPEGVRLQVPVFYDGSMTTFGVGWVYRSEDGRLLADVEMADPEHEAYDLTFSVTGQVLESVTRVDDGVPRPTSIRVKSLNVRMLAPAREGG